MPRDDRERNFEDALSRNLRAHRSAAPSGARSAPPLSPAPPPPDDCADVEILAAYHERLLTQEEMSFRKQHIASCSRCQEIIVNLEATEEIPFEIPLALDREAVAPTRPVAVPHLQLDQAAGSPAAQAAVAQATTAQPRFPVEEPLRFVNPRWLVPAGALAAGLLIWFAINKSAPQTGFQLAKEQPQSAPQSEPAPPPANFAKDKSPNLQAPSAAKTDALAKSNAITLDQKGAREPVAPPPSPSGQLKTPRADGQPGGFVIWPKQAQTPSRAVPQSPSENSGLARNAAPPPAAGAAPEPSNSVVNAETTTRSIPLENKKESALSGPTGAPATDESRANRGNLQPLSKAADLPSPRNPQLVSSPEGEVMWRLLPSGIVQRSADAGATWTVQKTGVVADLLAGSAPSAQTCWVVGRAGTILLTTDSGNRWMKVPSPTTEDITAVAAVVAQEATITTATNKSYKTTNAGITWTPQPNP
jgi:hypothetical protein